MATDPFRCSVVIPTFQRGDLIGRAVESALTQEVAPHEVIVVDDGSTDGTRRVIESLGGAVRYHYQTNRGASAARNLGVQVAAGEWIAFLDSDDRWLPGHLRHVADAIRGTNSRADLYFADAVSTMDGGEATWFEVCGFEPDQPFEEAKNAARWAMLPFQPMLLPAAVLRRSAWLELGGLREDLPTREDTHLFFQITLRGGACAVRHVGLDVTTDSAADLRLTEVSGPRSLAYRRASVVVYEDILTQAKDTEHARELRRRLASAHVALAGLELRASRRRDGFRRLMTATRIDPVATMTRLGTERWRRRSPRRHRFGV